MKNVQYDPVVIQKAADKLYRHAQSIVQVCTFAGIVAGLVFGLLFAAGGMKVYYTFAGAAILGLLGFALGQTRALVLRLQAQIALCHMRIEENTRTAEKAAVA